MVEEALPPTTVETEASAVLGEDDKADEVDPDDGTESATAGTVEVAVEVTVESEVDPGAEITSTTGVDPTSTTLAASTTAAETASSTAPTQSTATTTAVTGAGTGGSESEGWGSPETVRLRFESQVPDVPLEEFIAEAMVILTDPRGWGQAGFTFVADADAEYRVVLAEGPEVDQLCLPLRTFGKVSCQNGPVVALNADRWRTAVGHWELGVDVYRGYLVNHEVGHLLGQRHPKPRCPVAGQPAGVMEQQTAGLEGCVGNPWPRNWEISYAGARPVVYAPLPDWGPDPVPENSEGK